MEQFVIVEIPGHGEVEFPASMSEQEISAAAARLYAEAQGSDDDRGEVERLAARRPGSRTLQDRQAELDAVRAEEEALFKKWYAIGGGALKPGQSQEQAVAEAFPEEVKSLADRMAKVGLGQKWRRILGGLGAAGGALLGGLATGGRPGPGAAAAIAGGSALGTAAGSAAGSWLDVQAAENAGAVSPQEAAQYIKDNVIEDVAFDAAGNLFFFGAGKVMKVVASPAVRAKLANLALERAGAKGAATAERAAAGKRLQAETGRLVGETAEQAARYAEDLDASARAARELTARSGGYKPTKGQITGESGMFEELSRGGSPEVYRKQAAALERGAESLRRDVLDTPLSRTDVGSKVKQTAEAAKRAVEARTKPVFEEADRIGVKVDMTGIVQRIERILAENEAAGRKALSPREVMELKDTLKAFSPAKDTAPQLLSATGEAMERVTPDVVETTAQGAQDFIKGLKRTLRATASDGPPSGPYRKLVGDLVGEADAAYTAAIARHPEARASGLSGRLAKAREDYRGMMGTIFDDDAVQSALASNPEDVGKLFWQRGEVTAADELDKLLRLARKEGQLDEAGDQELRRRVLLGFLRDAAPDTNAAARWSNTMGNDAKRETFEKLVKLAGADGKELAAGMKVIEQAAQIARTGSATLGADLGTLSNAPGRAGVGVMFGYMNPVTAAAVGGAAALTRAFATASVNADKGMVNAILKVARASVNKEAANSTAIRKLVEDIARYQAANGIDTSETQ